MYILFIYIWQKWQFWITTLHHTIIIITGSDGFAVCVWFDNYKFDSPNHLKCRSECVLCMAAVSFNTHAHISTGVAQCTNKAMYVYWFCVYMFHTDRLRCPMIDKLYHQNLWLKNFTIYLKFCNIINWSVFCVGCVDFSSKIVFPIETTHLQNDWLTIQNNDKHG